MAVRFQFRRGTTAEWATADPVLAEGEPGLEQLVDGSYKLKIGDGATSWGALDYLPVTGPQGDAGPAGPAGPEGPPAEWVQLTQAAYNALSPPDPDTLYVIIG